MPKKLRACLAGGDQRQVEHRLRALFSVQTQLESLDEQSLHHAAHLIFGRGSWRARGNVEPLVVDPCGQVQRSPFITLSKLVCESDIHDKRLVSSHEKTTGREGVAGAERKACCRWRIRSIRLDGGDFERERLLFGGLSAQQRGRDEEEQDQPTAHWSLPPTCYGGRRGSVDCCAVGERDERTRRLHEHAELTFNGQDIAADRIRIGTDVGEVRSRPL